MEHEVPHDREYHVWLLDREHMSRAGKPDGLRVLRREGGRELFRVLNRDDRVEFAS